MMGASNKKFRNLMMLAILGVALLAIVVTGFGTGGMGGLQSGGSGSAGASLVDVGGEKLTDAEVSSRMEAVYRQAAQRDPSLDRGQFIGANFGPMMEGLTSDLSMVAFARSQGFVVPRLLVDRAIVAIPAFQNAAGQFDDATFRQALGQANMTERELRQNLEYAELVRMVSGPLSGGGRLPQAVATEYANLLLERRTGALGAVPTSLVARGIQPSDQDVAQFYQRNQRSFALPERRVLRYLLLGRDQLGDAVRATDQEVAAYYQQNQSRYGPGETRNIQLFTTQDEAAARNFAQQVRGGAGFVDAARTAGFAPEDINLPNQTREQFAQRTNPAFANTVYGAAAGTILGPQRTDIGFQIVRVEAINRTAGRPLEAVREEIVTAVEQHKLAEQLNALVERVEDKLGDGASLEEVAQAEHLQIQSTPPVAANGAGQNFQLPAELGPILRTGFEFSPEDDPQLEMLQPDRLAAVVAVGQVLPSAPPPFDQVKDQVRARLVQQTAMQRARAIAEGIATRINGGMAPAQAYAQAGMQLPPAQTLTLTRAQLAGAGQRVPPPVQILFALPQGRARAMPAPGGAGWIIVHHQQRTAGNARNDPQGSEAIRALTREIGEASESELRSQFARAVQSTLGVNRNEDAINALRQRLLTGR